MTSPFFLAVGAADRRKNLAVLHGAMRRVVRSNLPASLVLAGPRRGCDSPAPSAPWVRTLGFVSDSDLAVLYRRATALVMPSLYEGFGLPVLEAMRLGGPVICARASSLPEVAGDAAALHTRPKAARSFCARAATSTTPAHWMRRCATSCGISSWTAATFSGSVTTR